MRQGATARLFVAVDPPGAARRELTRWGRRAASSARRAGGRLRLLEPETLRVTLSFLGEPARGRVDAIAQAMTDAST